MNYRKFVFLYTSNFCSRINDFYCLEEWIVNGYNVEYWDLSAITCHEHLAEISIDGLVIRVVSSLREFRDLVKENIPNSPLYLTWVNYCWYSSGFYHLLSKYNCDYAFFDNGLLPIFSNTNVSESRKITFSWILNALSYRCYNIYYKILKSFLLKPACFYFQLSESYSGCDKINKFTIHGWCNSGDYERNQKISEIIAGKYMVFLDQYLPYHNDVVLNGQKHIDAKQYYDSLNSIFLSLENKYGFPVVIAAHPSAKKYIEINPFGGRRIYFDKTAELIKGSEFVIAHSTTAISYVVLNKKRMLLITSSAIKEFSCSFDSYIRQLASLLKLNCINLDSYTQDNLYCNEVSEIDYNKYKYDYLTNPFSEKISNFNSIIRTLNDQ